MGLPCKLLFGSSIADKNELNLDQLCGHNQVEIIGHLYLPELENLFLVINRDV